MKPAEMEGILKGSRGFYFKDTIFIRMDLENYGTAMHELLHAHASSGWKWLTPLDPQSRAMNEGLTDYFSLRATKLAKLKHTPTYSSEVAVFMEMRRIGVSEKMLERAYFDGAVDQLMLAIDSIRYPGAFNDLLKAMEKDDIELAIALLIPGT